MIDAEAIVNAVREVIEGATGSIRTVTVGDYSAQGYAGLPDEPLGLRARVKPRYDVQLESWNRTGDVANELSSRGIFELFLTIKLYWTTEHQVREDQRRETRAAVLEGVETIRRALCFPGNVAYSNTEAKNTNIVSGCLMAQPNSPIKIVREDWENRIVEVDMPLRALVVDSLPTS